MKRIVAVTAVLFLATPTTALASKPKPRPVPAVQLLTAAEACVNGWVWVDVTYRANVAGVYDLWTAGDNPFDTFVVETDTLAANETVVTSYSLSYPAQVDTFITRAGATQPLASRSVAAAPCTVTW